MRRISVRDFMNIDVLGEWPLPDEKLEIEFDDGILLTNTRRTVVSWFCWELHRRFPRTPIYKDHHIGNGFPNSTTTLDTMSRIVRDLHFAYFEPGRHQTDDHCYDREEVWKAVAWIQQNIFNTLSINLEEYQSSTDAFDMLELYDHPGIEEIRKDLKPNQLSITRAYERASAILMKDPSILHNPIVRGLRSKQIKMGQALQVLICRGKLTEFDNMIFPNPVMVGFFEGLTNLHDLMIESCSAKKALNNSKKPLRTVEYFNRKMQLSTATVRDLLFHDCGSTKYSEVEVSVGLFRDIQGKYYLDANDQLQIVTQADREHLIGKTIRMRSAFFCKHRGDGAVCRVCFGELAWSIPYKTNIGHVSCTEMCREGSQNVLSTKHHDGSAGMDDILITEHDQQYVAEVLHDPENPEMEGGEISALKFNPRLEKMEAKLILDSQQRPPVDNAAGLTGITKTTQIDHLSVHRVTSFREVQISTTNLRGEVHQTYVSVSQGARLGSLSRSMLRYIQQNGYTVDEDGRFVVDLAGWDFRQAVFALPMRHASMLDYMSEIEHFLRSPSKKDTTRASSVRKLKSYTDPVEALLDLQRLVSLKLEVNCSHLEVILLSLMKPAFDPDNYNLPHYDEEIMFEEHSKLINFRSAGALLAYERQPEVLEDVDTFLITDRPPHILDPLVHVSRNH